MFHRYARRLATGLFLSLTITGSVFGQRDAVVEEVIRLGHTDNRVMDHLTYLSEEIGHRLTSSTNLYRAEQWSVAHFESFGLEASLERWGEFPVGFDRHENKGAMVRPFHQELAISTNSWTAGTPGLVRALAVLEPEDPEELAAMSDQLAGQWVIRRSRERSDLRLTRKGTELISAMGVAGEVRAGGNLMITSGRHNVDPDELPTLVSVRLRSDMHKRLVERLEAAERVELEFDIDNRFITGPAPLYNVIADIPGTEFPDEYVIIGGHSDTWDGADGAQDNGTGMATTFEAARLLMAAGARPRRTIRFMFWSGEEQGLLGSRAYVKAHPKLMPKISAVLVHDGGTNVLSGLSGPVALVDSLRMATAPLRDLNADFPFAIRENAGMQPRGSSDHSSFIAAGVPGFFWRQGGAEDDQDYNFVHHTQHDTMEQVRPNHLRHSAMVVAITAYNLAMSDQPLSREGLIAPASRKMGVYLDGTVVSRVVDGGMAAANGWLSGDTVLKVDGYEVKTQRDIINRLQQADSIVSFEIQRGEEVLEVSLDYSEDKDEPRRMKAIGKRREREALKAGEESATR